MSSEELRRPGGLRKRVIAALVLTGLLVIFLPMFFANVPQNAYISKLPAAPKLPANKNFTLADFATPVPTTSVSAASGVWSIQTVTLTTQTQAEQLSKQLQQRGYPAYVQQVGSDKNSNYSVFIGPETDQSKLKSWVGDLQKQNMKGKIVIYNP